MTYKLIERPDGTQQIQRVDDGAWIPSDLRNGDYRAYLGWVEDGNFPTVENYVRPQVEASIQDQAIELLLKLAIATRDEDKTLRNTLLSKMAELRTAGNK